jgi:hypothetical protein
MKANTSSSSHPIATTKPPEQDANEHDASLSPHSAIFSIPNHSTTPAVGEEYSDSAIDGSFSGLILEGRPAPTSPSAIQPAIPTTRNYFQYSRHHARPVTSPQDSSRSVATNQLLPGQNQSPPIKSSLNVEETPFPSLVAASSSALPDYHATTNHGRADIGPSADRGVGVGQSPSVSGHVGGGRFPRWRGWLEKRALERHFERLDAAAGASGEADVKRKKSWGAGVNDEDALSESEDLGEVSPCIWCRLVIVLVILTSCP